jgi:ubiquitin-conjugating enzyme E2 J2
LANFVAAPDEKNIYEWYFCVFGLLDCPYEDGFYVGKIIFPKEYPFKPPGLMMITPNGRFEERKRICTSFSDFHPELWDPSWSVQTIVLGLLSFMLGNEITVSSMNIPDA